MTPLELTASAVRALTFFNVVALTWLGLTVLFNADRSKPGTWLTAGGLLIGSFCSIGRGVLLGGAGAPAGWEAAAWPIDWWRVSWLPFSGAAYLWSMVLIWYAGRLRTRREWLGTVALSGAGLAIFVLLLALLGFIDLPVSRRVTVGGYVAFATTCIVAALAALHHPREGDRFMGELAFSRARPWLIATSGVAQALSVAVGLALLDPPLAPLPLVDLLGSALVGLQVVLMGQAIVSYEVFTGKPLPRGGLAHHWRRSLILAAGLSAMMAISLELAIDETVRLLLAALLVTVFYALITWRLLAERERSLERLRPFVASRQLSPSLLGDVEDDGTAQPPPPGLVEPFRALCEELLGARVGHLCSVGPLAPLIGPPLSLPRSLKPPSDAGLEEIGRQIAPTGRACLAVDPRQYGGASWVVPLWNGPGIGGLLFLGDKRDGSLYTEEEIEIARATGERLIDAQATAELARRLLIVQRRRMAEEQIKDRLARRALHDDVLPLLHAALLATGSGRPAEGAAEEVAGLLTDAHRRVANLLRELPPAPAPAGSTSSLTGALRAAVCELAPSFDSVTWHLPNGDTLTKLALSGLATEVVFGATREAVRNAARHGRGEDPARPLHLSIALVEASDGTSEDIQVWIEDNGVGIDAGQRTSGSGQGLVLHGTLLAVLGGSLIAERLTQGGTRVTIRLPRSA